ncbi:hypothetical protein PG993_000196 [Apiospora rasikravindrae]|uniref:Metalloendopeptidase n=1 Tax=Apiospora rasikravindrae TaxID=990691 RepID=A0ABR1U7W6_9PEZI
MSQGSSHLGDVPYHPGAHNSPRSVPSTSPPESEWSSDSPYDDSDEDPTWVPNLSVSSTARTRGQMAKSSKKLDTEKPAIVEVQAGVSGSDDQIWPVETRELKVRFLDGTPEYKRRVEQLVTEHYNTLPMRLRFVFLGWEDTSTSDIRITFYTGYNSSYVGLDNRNRPQNEPTMDLNMNQSTAAWVQHIVLHEFGHALGLKHEHQHPDCSFQWNLTKLKASGKTQRYIDINYKKLSPDYPKVLTPYDENSIMHYNVDKGDARKSTKYVPLSTVLSSGDKSLILKLYPPPIPDPPKKRKSRVPRSPVILAPKTTIAKPPVLVSKSLTDRISGLTISSKPPATWSTSQPAVHVSGFANTEVKGGNVLVSSCGNTVINGDSYVNITGSGTVILNGNGTVVMSGSGTLIVNGDCVVMASGAGSVRVKGSGKAQVSGSACVKFSGECSGTVSEKGSIQQYCSL